MGFDCIHCGKREIWSFEAMQPRWFPTFARPFICLDCFDKHHATPEEREIIKEKRGPSFMITSTPPSEET